MLQLIDFSVCILTVVSIYFINNLSAKPNKNIILETTLPYSKLNDPEVIKIANEYKRSNLYGALISIVISLPCLLINIASINIIYLLLWMFIMLIINGLIMRKYVIKLRTLKSDNNWFYGAKHIVSIDTEVSRIKHTMPVSKLYFLISLAFNIIPIIILKGSYPIMIGLPGIFTTLVCILFYHIYSIKQLTVYSENSDVNLTCNLVYKRTWSLVWVLLSILFSAYSFFICFYTNLIGAFTILVSSLTLIIIVIAHLHIRNIHNSILILESDVIYTDEDEYWGTFFYSNPHDRNLFVDKRSGIGTTVNMAHPKAKVLSFIIILILLITLIPAIFLSISSDLANIDFSISNNNVTIKASIYDVTFNKDDIEDITFIDSLPKKGIKTNGASTDNYAYGNFNYNGLGKCMVFTKKEAGNKILLIKLKDKYILLTGDTEDETTKIYNQLI